MGEIIEEYKQRPLRVRLLFLGIISLSIPVIIILFLGIFGIINSEGINYMVQPLMAMILAFNGILMYKQSKIAGIFLFSCTAFLLIAHILY